MNDSELRKRFAARNFPPAAEHTRERARWHALAAFRNAAGNPRQSLHNSTTVFPWKMAASAVLVCVLLLMVVFSTRHLTESRDADPRPLLAELEKFFQGRLAAVIQHDGEIDLRLRDDSVARPPDQRVAVEIEWRNQKFVILTYSGEAVCLESEAGELCLTPLITGSGEVIIIGETGLMKNARDLRATARALQGT